MGDFVTVRRKKSDDDPEMVVIGHFPNPRPGTHPNPLPYADLRSRQQLAEDWQEEAAQAALEGKPEKARYIEIMKEQILG